VWVVETEEGKAMFFGGMFLSYVVVAVLIVIPFWKIFERAGFSPVLSLLMLIPLVNICMIYFLAFSKWPKQGGTPS